MPIIKSAKKRVRRNEKAATRNAYLKRSIRRSNRELLTLLDKGKDVSKQHSALVSLIDKAAKKKVFHKNKAARKKSQLSQAIKKHSKPGNS